MLRINTGAACFQDKVGTLTGRKEGGKEGRGPGMEGASVAPAAFGPASSAFPPLPASSPPPSPRGAQRRRCLGRGRQGEAVGPRVDCHFPHRQLRPAVRGRRPRFFGAQRAGSGAALLGRLGPRSALLSLRPAGAPRRPLLQPSEGPLPAADAGVAPLGAADKRAGEGAGAAPPAPRSFSAPGREPDRVLGDLRPGSPEADLPPVVAAAAFAFSCQAGVSAGRFPFGRGGHWAIGVCGSLACRFGFLYKPA